jgi:guanylate kinase
VKPERLLIVVSAPSGAGKTTLCQEAVRRLPRLVHSVSYTTRPPRPDERDGRDYHFVDEATFRRMVAEGAFAEWATVHGHLYGTSRKDLEAHWAAGNDAVLDIDTQGAAILRGKFPDGVFVFILPPSVAQLEARLRSRRTDAPEEIARRLAKARTEMAAYPEYEYVVVNDDVERAVGVLCAIITAERAKTRRFVPGPGSAPAE